MQTAKELRAFRSPERAQVALAEPALDRSLFVCHERWRRRHRGPLRRTLVAPRAFTQAGVARRSLQRPCRGDRLT